MSAHKRKQSNLIEPPAKRALQQPKTLHVYAVMRTNIKEAQGSFYQEDDTESTLELYVDIKDANYRVRKKYEEAGRGMFEQMETKFEGPSWDWEGSNEDQSGVSVYIKKWEVMGPGSEKAEKWEPPEDEEGEDGKDEELGK